MSGPSGGELQVLEERVEALEQLVAGMTDALMAAFRYAGNEQPVPRLRHLHAVATPARGGVR